MHSNEHDLERTGPLTRGVPGWIVAALLVVCLFSPYGWFDQGGGTLRLDHVAVYATFVCLLLAGRLAPPPVLAVGLFAFASLSLLGTLFVLEDFFRDSLSALKSLDGILRGPLVLTIAASLRGFARDRRRVIGTIGVVAVVLGAMSLAESFLPAGHPVVAWMSHAYGGEGYAGTDLAATGINHKEVMLVVHRASAVFMTPPSLSFAAIFFLILAGLAPTGRSGVWRGVVIVAALACGFASRSKSFALGVPMLVVLNAFRSGGHRGRLFLTLIAAGAAIAIAVDLTSDQPEGPLALVVGADDPLDALTSGRFTHDESILAESGAVLADSPILGYGISQHEGRRYSDSGINRLVLHAGLLGLLAVALGIVAQLSWLVARRSESGWRDVGMQTLLMGLAFFFAGAMFQMPRINDLFFTILGLGIASLRLEARVETSLATDRRLAGPRALRTDPVAGPALVPR